jgi:hypothetical protein
MVIFMPQDENKSCIYRKKLEFSVYIIHFSFLTLKFETFLKFVYWQNLKESSQTRHRWKYGKYVPLQWKINIYSENTENKNTHFISSIFLNIYIINLDIIIDIGYLIEFQVPVNIKYLKLQRWSFMITYNIEFIETKSCF